MKATLSSPRKALVVLIAIAIGTTLAPATASAGILAEESLTEFGEFGTQAGELSFGGGGIGIDPGSGHVFVSETENDRISEFTAWGEFVKAWGWGVADGSSELQTCGPPEPQLDPDSSLCRAGAPGSGPGQLRSPGGVAISPGGDIYVFERENHRVQVFAQDGAFVTMFGGGVNQTSGADVCSAADLQAGDECGAGSSGTAPGEFLGAQVFGTLGDYVDFGPDGLLYVGDRDRIQKFEADGTYVGSLALPKPGDPGSLAIDPVSGDIYFSYRLDFVTTQAYRLDGSSGVVLYKLPTTAIQGIAVGPDGTAFAADDPVPDANKFPEDNPVLREISQTGEVVESCCRPIETADLWGLETNVVTDSGGAALYLIHSRPGNEVSFVELIGPPPAKWPAPKVPPAIEAQFAKAVGEESATLAATINPNFWADTSYRLEYGITPCSEGGCQSGVVRELGAGVVRKPVDTKGVQLSGLQPGTTYHYRYVAESGGGGPVVGPDRTFTTFAAPATPETACPNQNFRTGPSAALPDCRAHELVSPVDKAGGDILVIGNGQGTPARLSQATPSGEAIAFSSYRAFGDAQSAPYTSQYVARRGAESWASEGISPPRRSGSLGALRDSNYKAFMEDLSAGWLVQESEPILAAGAVPGDYANLYRRDASGDYEALSTVSPTGLGVQDYGIEMQGFSADGSRSFFRANAKLTANAGPNGPMQVYEVANGKLRLVSVLPNGTPAAGSSLGSRRASAFANNREANTATAVSEDGTRAYWSEAAGRVFVRVNTVKTVAVSSGAASFWAATPDGGAAIYTEEGALKLFALADESSTTLATTGVEGVLGQSEDLTRVYFTSSAALAGGAEAGEPNLYLYEEGQPLELVATLAASDRDAGQASPVSLSPLLHLSRVSADGGVAVFMSRAPLTGADNVDQVTKQLASEVFRYEAATGDLRCVSCSPTGEAPRGRDLEITQGDIAGYYASRIPTTEFQLHTPRVIAAGGERVFFNSLNRLVPADTNGLEDVYEWEAPGTGGCEEDSAAFVEVSGGCVYLISSGRGNRDSEFVDASADGRDAFFLTSESLVEWDPAQIDLYDAREGGGLPAPPGPAPACEGEACQGQVTLPAEPGLASESFRGAGNPKPPAACRKGFVRKKGKCVRKQGKKKQKQQRSKQERHRH